MKLSVNSQLQIPATTLGTTPIAPNTSAAIARMKRDLGEASRLERILREVKDVSHLSPDLLQRAIEQGCWYHVTPFRSALIRSLEIPHSARVLEVGCGGGALTRYLGEQGYQVVALETSEELAECARIRCRDLANVEIITGFLEQVLVDYRFDFVVCVDPRFVESEFFDPGLQLITLCKKVLKSTGTLILSVGNPLHAPGEAHIEPSVDHVRGKGAPLQSLKRSLVSAGFTHSEEYITFPNHAAPRLLIDPAQARRDRLTWISLVKDLYRGSEVAEEEIERWWRAVHNEGLERYLAPGWLIIAHSHAVHSVLWNSGAGKFYAPTVSPKNSDSEICSNSDNAIEVSQIFLDHAELVATVLDAAKPVVNGVKDYKDSLIAADQRIDELALKESVARDQLLDTQQALDNAEARHSIELSQEQESRRIREAELGLVLKQYHAVGAMCHDMREEGRKLKDMLDELKRRYVAAEEWGSALSKRVVEAEQELEQTQSSLIYRWVQKLRRLVLYCNFKTRSG
jgi:2-polyprenyl-3-methyl-5-hydroxy-6-metoxy-1,4-benzoquinol methylase